MPDVTQIKGFSFGFETSGTDKANYRFPEITKIHGFSFGFETMESDRRYLEDTKIHGFSFGFEHNPLRAYSVTTRRI